MAYYGQPNQQQPQYPPQQPQYPPPPQQYPQHQQPQYPQQQQPHYGQQPQYPPQQQQYPQQQPQYPPQHQPGAQPNYSQPPQQQHQQPQYGQPQQQQQPQRPNNNPYPGGAHHQQQPATNPRPPSRPVAATRSRERPELPKVTPVTTKMRETKLKEEMLNPITNAKFTEEELASARNEHNYPKLTMSTAPADNREEVGMGMVFYFEFIKFLSLVNMIFLGLQVINYAVFASDVKPGFDGSSGVNGTLGQRSWYHDFMITTYTDDQKGLWLAMNVIAIIFCFVCAPLYYFLMDKREIEEVADDEEEVQYMMVRFTAEGAVDVSDAYRTAGDLILRRFAAWFVVLMFIGIQIVASYFITKNEGNASFGSSLGIAIIVSTLNGIFRFCAQYLTELEKWDTFGKWKRYHTIKLLFFKLGNVITVYSAKDYGEISKDQCTYDIIGEQFITLLLVEIIGINLMEVAFSMLWSENSEKIARTTGSILGDQDLLAPFELANQYLSSIYRQYLCIMAMVVCPLSIALGVIGFFVQYWVDKFRLFKICGRPKRMATSQKGFLSSCLICIAIVSMVTPYAGSIFMMSGWTRDTSSKCKFP